MVLFFIILFVLCKYYILHGMSLGFYFLFYIIDLLYNMISYDSIYF